MFVLIDSKIIYIIYNEYIIVYDILLGKYGTAYGAGGQSQIDVYLHEEDESTCGHFTTSTTYAL